MPSFANRLVVWRPVPERPGLSATMPHVDRLSFSFRTERLAPTCAPHIRQALLRDAMLADFVRSQAAGELPAGYHPARSLLCLTAADAGLLVAHAIATDPKTGLRAAVLAHADGHEAVLVFSTMAQTPLGRRQEEAPRGSGWMAALSRVGGNCRSAIGPEPPAYRQAAALTRSLAGQFTADRPQGTLRVMGHGEGGAIAIYAALQQPVISAVAFCPYPLTDALAACLPDASLSQALERVSSYVTAGDPVFGRRAKLPGLHGLGVEYLLDNGVSRAAADTPFIDQVRQFCDGG